MAFGSGFDRFEVQKNASEGVIYPHKKLISFSYLGLHTPLTGVACWKLKGLARLVYQRQSGVWIACDHPILQVQEIFIGCYMLPALVYNLIP
jgi:hypothetical protein